MAEKLARMYGTEEDKVNCPFYFKIGACRYGDKCLRIHNKPPYSQTLLIKNMYTNLPVELALASGNKVSEDDASKALQHFEDFYEEVFLELANYGEIDDLVVCDNIGDHMLGNVYVKFTREEDAIKCMEAIRNRYYDGKILMPEYSPVTDFSNAKCKQFIEGSCKRGGYCNYMHLKPVSNSFKKSLFRQMYDEHPEFRKRKSKSRSNSKDKKRSKSNNKEKGDKKRKDNKDKEKKSRKHRSRSRSRSGEKEMQKNKRRSGSSNKDHSPRGGREKEMNSEERRAMIAKWNDEGSNDEEPADQKEERDNNHKHYSQDDRNRDMQEQQQYQQEKQYNYQEDYRNQYDERDRNNDGKHRNYNDDDHQNQFQKNLNLQNYCSNNVQSSYQQLHFYY